MEEDLEPSGSPSLVPLALAILATVLGAAGLYFGLTASQRLNPISASIEEGTSGAAQLEKELGALQTQLAELRAQTDELAKALDRTRIYSSQSERALKQLAGNVKENREEIVKQAEQLNKLASGGGGATAARSSTGGDPGTAAAEAEAGEAAADEASGSTEGIYRIRAGDNFTKVARDLGVGLQALIDANPQADPNRLQIGQEINIPPR